MIQAHSKPLSSLGIKKMRSGGTLTHAGEFRGLRVARNTAGTRFIYRFRHPDSNRLTQITLGHEPVMSLADARKVMLEQKQLVGKILIWIGVSGHLMTRRPMSFAGFTLQFPTI